MRRTCVILALFYSLAAFAPCAESAATTSATATADLTTKDPQEIATKTISKVLKILVLPDYDAKKKDYREQIRTAILSVVDMKSVGLLTLANYRDKFSDEQFKQFTKTFSQLLFSTYIGHLEKYSDQPVLILGTDRPSPTRAVVKTKTITKTGDSLVDLYFAKEDGHWHLYDVHIEGVSMIRNYRSQFRDILMKRSAEQLLKQLEDKVKENEEKL